MRAIHGAVFKRNVTELLLGSACEGDAHIKTWRISDGALLQTIDGNNNGIISIAFSPDQQIIAAGSGDRVYDGVVRFWRFSDGVLLRFFNQDPNNLYSYVTAVACSPDGSLFAFARADGLLVVARPFRPRF
jgi:WD40 repeat protein